MAELLGSIINGNCKTGAEIAKTFTASGSYTIPAGFAKIDLFAVGGGGGSGYGDDYGGSYSNGCGGGGGGYTKTVKNIAVAAGQVLSAVVGAGGIGSTGSYHKDGSASSVLRSGTTLISADGGKSVPPESANGEAGGSGGGTGGMGTNYYGAKGGSNGSNGYDNDGTVDNWAAIGQGTTTRAWGNASGTLYAGGGGGAGKGSYGGGAGGAGGGGAGGYNRVRGANGAANTGGGGGGSAYYDSFCSYGGTGIILARLY